MIPAAITINNSGIPNANKPDRTVLIPVDNPDDTTKGIKAGLKKPERKTTVPHIKRFFGGLVFFADELT